MGGAKGAAEQLLVLEPLNLFHAHMDHVVHVLQMTAWAKSRPARRACLE